MVSSSETKQTHFLGIKFLAPNTVKYSIQNNSLLILEIRAQDQDYSSPGQQNISTQNQKILTS